MWANFASAGASWNIHKENFFKSNFINVLNLKASYGTNGNSRIGRQEADGVYVVSDSYQYGGALGAGMSNPAKSLSILGNYLYDPMLVLGLQL